MRVEELTVVRKRVRHARALISLAAVANLVLLVTSCTSGSSSSPDRSTTPSASQQSAGTTSAPSAATASEPTGTESASASTAQPATQYLGDLEPLSSSGLSTGAANVNGTAYARSVYFSADKSSVPQGSAEYDLGRDWRTLTATIGLRDDSPTGCELRLETFTDGNPTSSETLGIGESRALKLNVTQVLRVKLQVTYVSTADVANYCYGVWGDARLAS